MYQMVMHAKEQLDLNIITVEDPVEQLVSGITQVSINEKQVSIMQILLKRF